MTRRSNIVRLLPAALVVLAMTTCSGGGGGGGTGGIPYDPNPDNPGNPGNPGQPSTPAANEVFLRNSAFDPITRTVPAGTTVTWSNVGLESTHTITPDGHTQFARQEVSAFGVVFSHRFDVPGTYNYHCEVHGFPGAGMFGRIVVQ